MTQRNMPQRSSGLDSGLLARGFVYGLVIGGVVALFTLPKSGQRLRRDLSQSVNTTGQQLRATIDAAIPPDPVEESIAEGKAAARRRRAELGIETPTVPVLPEGR